MHCDVNGNVNGLKDKKLYLIIGVTMFYHIQIIYDKTWLHMKDLKKFRYINFGRNKK